MVILAHLGKIKRGIGIDISQNAINIARTALIPHDCDINFQHIPKHGIYPIGVFDTILCLHVLHHVPRAEQRDFIRKLSRISFSGRLILTDISPKPFWRALVNSIHDLLINKEFVYYSGETKVQKWLQKDGFSIIEYRSMKMFGYSNYMIVAEKKI